MHSMSMPRSRWLTAAIGMSLWIPLLATSGAARAASLAEAIDQPDWTVSTGGGVAWSAQTGTTHTGGSDDLARSAIGAGKESWIRTAFDLPEDGIATCWGQLDKASETADVTYDVYLDGAKVGSVVDDDEWHKVNVWATAGAHTLLWKVRSASNATGTHTAYLDACRTQAGGFELTVSSLPPDSKAGMTVDQPDLFGKLHGWSVEDGAPMKRYHKPGRHQVIAAPSTAGLFFSGWSGCTNASGTRCEIDLQGDAEITATYAVQPPVTIAEGIDELMVFQTGRLDNQSDQQPAGWYGDNDPDFVPGLDDTARVSTYGQSSYLETTKDIPANRYVLFCWGCIFPDSLDDSLSFLVDGDEQAVINGPLRQECRVFPVAAGANRIFRWELAIGGERNGSDAYVDSLEFLSTPPQVTQTVKSIPPGQTVAVSPAANGGVTEGTTEFSIKYLAGTPITLTAQENPADPHEFVAWLGCDSVSGSNNEQCQTVATNGTNIARYQWKSDAELAESVDQPSWTFSSGGAAGWVGRLDVSEDGVDAAVSGRITDGEESFFETTRNFPGGYLQFSWKVSSAFDDGLALYIDDLVSPKFTISGISAGWQHLAFPLADGEHVVRWVYAKSAQSGISCASCTDAGWVDQIRFVPEGIAGLQASDGTLADGIVLTWQDSPDELGYRVYRRATGASGYTLLGETGAGVVTFTDTSPSCGGAIYEYIVTAVLPGGESSASAPDTGFTAGCLPAPATVSASDGLYADRIRVTWGDASGRTGFRVYRSANVDSGFVGIGETSASVRTFDDPSASCGQTWYYGVRAFDASGESLLSVVDAGSTKPCPPAAPTGVATDGDKFKIRVSWDDVGGESGYRVYRRGPEDSSYTLVATVGAGAGGRPTFADQRECGSESYSYKVVAFNAGGDSADSAPSAAATQTCGLNVVAPAEAATWPKLSRQTISWNGALDTGKVKIQLFKGKTLISTVSPGVPTNAGSLEWVPPGSLKLGTDYQIKVIWLSNAAITGTSKRFVIADSSSGPVTVTAPASPVAQGEKRDIAWSGIPQTGNVSIKLYQGATYKSTVIASTPNDGSFEWTVPGALATTTGPYQLRVTWLSKSTVYGTSGDFTVSATDGPITVSSPTGGDAWHQGTTRTVAWGALTGSGKVKIDLLKNGVFFKTLSSSTDDDGTENVAVPAVPAANPPPVYTVKVTWLSNQKVSGTSGSFSVE